ncbi:LuxR C-terminal-related transcriptional regulator [Rhodococcus hoagii]|nr:LuxR C-terminal-related transcriptional regulator [Prescottella equi]
MTQELTSDETVAWAPPRLVNRLRRNASLTVMRAPRGFGKSHLASAWLAAAREAGRLAVHVSPPASTISTDEYWAHVVARLPATDDPVDIVLERVDLLRDATVERRICNLLDDHPSVNVVATVVGRSMFEDPLSFAPDHDALRADDLLYTRGDLQELFRSAGLDPTAADMSDLHRRTGGMPQLCIAVVAAMTSAHPLTRDVLEQAFTDTVTRYVHDDILPTVSAEHRRFLVRTATAHALTADLAKYLGGGPDSAGHLHDLEAAGFLDHLDTVDGDSWRLPPAVRTELIAVQRTEGLDPAARSTLLALHHLDLNDHAAALRCAADAENWELAVELLSQHAATLASSHVEVLRDALLAFPESALDAQPGITALHDLMRQLSGDPSNDVSPYDTADLLDLTVAEDPREALTVVGNRILLQRLGGDYETAADQTRRLHGSVRRLLDTEPDSITDLLPFLRVQSGLTYQLAGDFAESTVELRLAHRLGAARRMDYITRNAAGNSALNWAFAGELQRAHDWLATEDKTPPVDEWTEALIRIGGAVARALTAIDSLDLDTAGYAIDSLRELPEVAELWPFVTFARCRYAIATGAPALGLGALAEFAEARTRANGTFVRSLLDAIEIEVRLALCDVARARALADSVSCETPWGVVAVARTYLLTGDHQAAITTCRKYDWLGTPYARAHLEALLIEAVAACRLGREADALRAWSHACSIADRTGIQGAFATIERRAVVALGERAGRPSPTLAQFLAAPAVEHYPTTLEFPQLTARERTVLDGVARGLTVGQIAALMFLSTSTVKTHKRTLYRKLDAHTRAEAIDRARTFGFLAA